MNCFFTAYYQFYIQDAETKAQTDISDDYYVVDIWKNNNTEVKLLKECKRD
jgi:hypothetical protein